MDTKRAIFLYLLAACSLRANAYGFSIDSSPTQCGQLSISITGSGGKPPYRLGIVPWGSSPLQGGQLEVRRILDIPFNDSSHVSFTLPYPKNSQFVAVVSDNGAADPNFASGGITVPVSVTGSQSDDCLPKNEVSPSFPFGTDPLGVLTTCQASFLTWASSNVTGNVKFWGVIPGGNGFIINGSSTNDQGKDAISWTPTVTTGTGILVVAGDSRGFGSGGSFQGFVQPGNGTTSCLGSDAPKSTPGSPAGGSYPTDSSGDKTSGGHNNIGPIVGGVIGGVVGIAVVGVVVFLLLRRRRHHKRTAGEPVDLLEGREGERHEDAGVPEQYLPEPYHIPPSTSNEMSETASAHPLTARDRRISGLSLTTQTRLSSEETSTMPGRSTAPTSAKSPAGPPHLRAVNIIQHEDAGPSEAQKEEEQETVELPPAYTNLRG